MRRRLTSVAATLTAVALVSCGSDPQSAGPVERFDEKVGMFRGVRLGEPFGAAKQRLGVFEDDLPGPKDLAARGIPWNLPPPPGYEFGEDLPPSASFDDQVTVRYDERNCVYHLSVRGVYARTLAGVSIGDSLASVRDRYPGAECGVQNEDSEDPEYPYCHVRVRHDRWLWFGQDPIRSITLGVRSYNADETNG